MAKCWFLLFFLTLSAQARERLGQLEVEDLTLRPRFAVEEPSDGSFDIGESTLGFRWSLIDNFSSVFRLGSRQLINPVARFSDSVADELTLIEGYISWVSNYGELRMGLLPLQFGVEGDKLERELRFSRSLLFEQRIVGLRDLGLSYRIDFNGYFTGFTIHNGEGGEDRDGRVWYTAEWGWSDERKFQLGIAGQTGTTKPIATSTSADTLAQVDPTREALWRLGGIFMEWSPSQWKTVLETYVGERVQGNELEKYTVGHWDLIYDSSAQFGVQLRYDSFDPSAKVTGNWQQEVSIGFRISDIHQTSNFYLIGTKRLEERGETANDRLQIIWSATP